MFKKALQQGRNERRGEAYSAPYVEPLSDARTTLETFFNILLGQSRGVRQAPSTDHRQCHPVSRPIRYQRRIGNRRYVTWSLALTDAGTPCRLLDRRGRLVGAWPAARAAGRRGRHARGDRLPEFLFRVGRCRDRVPPQQRRFGHRRFAGGCLGFHSRADHVPAMNRSLVDVMVGSGPPATKDRTAEDLNVGRVKAGSPEDVALLTRPVPVRARSPAPQAAKLRP
jgi:hypothetical protein